MSTIKSRWFNTTRSVACRICGHKDGWCTYSDDGAIHCRRVASDKQLPAGGWLHKTGTVAIPVVSPTPKPVPNVPFHNLITEWKKDTPSSRFISHAIQLGVEPISLLLLGAVWCVSKNAWAYPMLNAFGEIIGIRFRNESGDKWAWPGSRQGLFIPQIDFGKTVYCVEGATDVLAAMSIGLSVIGRPSCMGCEDMVVEFIKLKRIRWLVIISDNDTPDNGYAGQRGAARLQERLKIPSVVISSIGKDIREDIRAGLDARDIQDVVKNMVWTVP